MGMCCTKVEYNTISSIEYEEYDNYVPMLLGLENIKIDLKDKVHNFKQSMNLSVLIKVLNSL